MKTFRIDREQIKDMDILATGYKAINYDLQGNKKWYTIAFPDLIIVDNKTAYSKMPLELINYFKSLPEFDKEIFEEITEIEVCQATRSVKCSL